MFLIFHISNCHFNLLGTLINEFPWWLSGKEPACQSRRLRFNPCVRKIPRRRKWKPTPVFLPGESHRQRSQMGYRSCRYILATYMLQRVGHDWVTEVNWTERYPDEEGASTPLLFFSLLQSSLLVWSEHSFIFPAVIHMCQELCEACVLLLLFSR